MKTLFTLFFLIAISTNISAQTQVSGNQSGTWNSANSPYEVIGDLTVPAGEVLTIEAGVEVNFQGYYKFSVTGNLHALGTETDSIFFTTDNPATGWGGIRVDVADYDDIISLLYCRIEFGKSAATAYPDIHGGGLALLTSNAIISNCVFSDNDATGSNNGMGGAIYAINTGDIGGEALTFITDCKFIRNHCYGEGGAIKFTSDGNTEITKCEFIENDCLYGGGAISFYGVVDTKMIQCLFANNYTMYANGGAIHMLGFGNSMFFKNCTFSENVSVNGEGGGVYIVNGVIDFVNCIAYNNSAFYGGTQGDNIYVNPDGSTAEINYCNVIMPEYGASGSNNINENPLFVDANTGDFHLQETSPCIDTGTDIGLPYIGNAPDMGCYEYGWIDAPYAVTYQPIQNATDIEFDAVVSVTFNEDVSEVDLNYIEITDAANIPVTGISSVLEADNRTITISHNDFVENTVYTVTIPENSVQNSDIIGNQETTWNFTTKVSNFISDQNSLFLIYPNPTTGHFLIKNILQNNANITITDISGKIVKQLLFNNKQLSINISENSSGIYFIKIRTKSNIFTYRIIKK